MALLDGEPFQPVAVIDVPPKNGTTGPALHFFVDAFP
jgi:hypothetical protein